MIGDTFYTLDTDHDDNTTVIMKVTQVGLDEVDLNQGEGGVITVTARPVPAPPVDKRKYRLEPSGEDGLSRLVLLHDIPGYYAGQRGGLVSDERNLFQGGTCWIDESSMVTGDARVYNHAQVIDSVLDGKVVIRHHARVSGLTLRGSGHLTVEQSAELCNVNVVNDGQICLSGGVKLFDSNLTASGNAVYTLAAGCADGADIHNFYEMVSMMTPWGWLTGYRDREGELRFSVGCQTRGNFGDMRALGRDYDIDGAQTAMLEGFLQMVAAAKTKWVASPEPEPEPETLQDLAAKARLVADDLLQRPVLRLPHPGDDEVRDSTF